MKASLLYYWRIHLAVFAGTAVAVAVLTGALGVGDSVRESLKLWNLERLGQIQLAIVQERFFRSELVGEIDQALKKVQSNTETVGLLATRGSGNQPDRHTRMGQLNIFGVGSDFPERVFPNDRHTQAEKWVQNLANFESAVFPPVVINESVQHELGCELGDHVIFNLQQHSRIHRDSLFGDKSSESLIASLRCEVVHILPNRGMGRFSLKTSQTAPGLAFVPVEILQRSLGVIGKFNTLLVSTASHSKISISSLESALQNCFRPEDAGIGVTERAGRLVLGSDEWSFAEGTTDAIIRAAHELDTTPTAIFTYLANKMTFKEKVLPYSAVSALEPEHPLIGLNLSNGQKAPALEDDEILLNQWAAADLGVTPGDRVTMEYFAAGEDGSLVTRVADFKVLEIVAMTGSGADSGLSPEIPGIHDADDMGSWEPPFSMDFSLIRPKDETYWDDFGGAPKAFVSWQTGQRLWKSRFGNATAVTLAAPDSQTNASFRKRLEDLLCAHLRPEAFGYRVDDLQVQSLKAAKGNTDFGMLFIGFSMFIIAAAALLAGMLFKLGIEQRVSELGLLAALGYTPRHIRRRFLWEGAVLVLAGGLAGLGAAKVYLDAMVYGLNHWWNLGLGNSLLESHLLPMTLLGGYVAGVFITLGTLFLTLRSLVKLRPLTLLRGNVSEETSSRKRAPLFWFGVSLTGGVTTLIIAWITGKTDSAMVFFLAGVFFLLTGLSLFSLMMQGRLAAGQGRGGLGAPLAWRNLVRHPGRNLLCVTLVACACFVLATVGVNRRNAAEDTYQKPGPTGGFGIWAKTEIPLHLDLNSEEDRFEMGLKDSLSEKLQGCRVHQFRFLEGDDASCLNLQQPKRPHILGVPSPEEMKGRFVIQEQLENESGDPWDFLNADLGQDIIPAVADYESARWIMHKKLGDDLDVVDEHGRLIKIRLVGLLKKSMLQSEILISERQFVRHFSTRSGTAYFLVDAPENQLESLARDMEDALSAYGWDSGLTKNKVWAYKAVVNTYLAVFQVLGGLGLVLGSLGLGIVMFRNILERRKELGCLRAVGFSSQKIFRILLTENGILIIMGVLVGSFSALVSGIPHYYAVGFAPPVGGFVALVAFVLVCGLGTGILAIHFALKRPLLEELKSE